MPPLKRPIKKTKKPLPKIYLSEKTRTLFETMLDSIRALPKETQTKLFNQINSKLIEQQKQDQQNKMIKQRLGLEKKGTVILSETKLKNISKNWTEKNKELMTFLLLLSKMPEEKAQKTIKDIIKMVR
jgi:hypothetical protein